MAYDYQFRSGMGYALDLTISTLRGCAGQVTNAMVSASAAIASSKLVNRVQAVYQQTDGANITDTTGEGVPIYVCDKTNGATIKKVSALVPDVGDTDATVAVQVHKYDLSTTTLATILSADIDVTASEADYETVNGTISDTDMATGDVLMVQVVYTATGVEHQGLMVQVEIDEEGS